MHLADPAVTASLVAAAVRLMSHPALPARLSELRAHAVAALLAADLAAQAYVEGRVRDGVVEDGTDDALVDAAVGIERVVLPGPE